MAVEVLVISHVREKREERGFTLLRLAEAAGLKKSYVGNGENGRTDWRVSQLLRLAQVLQCHPLDLITFPGFASCACPGKERVPDALTLS